MKPMGAPATSGSGSAGSTRHASVGAKSARRAPIEREWPAALIVMASMTFGASARAQCSANASSCLACHEAQGAHSVLGDRRPWHADHGFGDLCVACHGGDAQAASKDAAHADMREPLAMAQSSCGGCHSQDFAERALRYQVALGEASLRTPNAGARPTPPPSGARTIEPTVRGHSAPNRILAAGAVLIAGMLAALVARDRGLKRDVRPIAWLRAESWSAIAAGAWLGVTVAVSEAAYGQPIAASGAFERLAAYLGRAIFPQSPYYAYVMRPAITWPVWLMLGAVAGSFTSARLAGVARWRWLPDAQWTESFGTAPITRLIVGFLGAVLMQIGAGIAGGCTSGLAISGGAVLSPAAFVFMAAMFAGGIPTAAGWALLQKKKRARTR